MFLARIIGEKDNQQWRCWLEKVTIVARDPWRDFVKNTVIQLHLKGKEESPLNYPYLWLFNCALHVLQGAWKVAIKPGRGELFFLGSMGGSIRSNHEITAKLGAAWYLSSSTKAWYLNYNSYQSWGAKQLIWGMPISYLCFTSSYALLSEPPSFFLSFCSGLSQGFWGV